MLQAARICFGHEPKDEYAGKRLDLNTLATPNTRHLRHSTCHDELSLMSTNLKHIIFLLFIIDLPVIPLCTSPDLSHEA